MRAVVWDGPCSLQVKEVEKPGPGPGEVLVRTKAVGICGTDLELFEGRFGRAKPPLIPGHEGGGVVEERGVGVEAPQPGSRVIVECIVHCGECEYCRAGLYGLCDHGKTIGLIGADGEYADYFTAPADNCYRLPDSMSWEEAALVDTLAGPIHGLKPVALRPGDTVAVFGPGPAGLFFCRLCKLGGAGRVFLAGTRPERLERGSRYGADVIIDVDEHDPVEIIRSESGGAHLVVEAAGSPRALRDGIGSVRKGGTLLVYGVFGGGPVEVDLQSIQAYEITVFGSCGLDYPAAIELIAGGKVDARGLVTHRYGLEELVGAFTDGSIRERRDGYMKGVVIPEIG